MGKSYEEIRNLYHNFFCPAVKIEIDGRELSEELQCRIHGVSVDLFLGVPSYAQFTVADCYDTEEHKMKNRLMSKLLPGSKVTVSLGYGSCMSTVFAGCIDCVEIEFSEDGAKLVRVTAADVCKAMQDNGVRKRIIRSETHSEAFLEIMKSYTYYCSSDAESTEIKLPGGLFQEESDFDFVSGRLVRETGYGFEFLVEKGKAFFRRRDQNRSPVIEISPEQGVMSLRIGRSYVNREIEVLGYSLEQGGLSSNMAAEAPGIDSRAAKGKEIFNAPWAAAAEDTKKLASCYSAYLAGQACRGEITTVGLPVLLPGNCVALKHVDPAVDGNHYMTRVKHELGDDGYVTTVSIL